MRTVYALLLLVAISRLVIGFSMIGDPKTALPVLESFNTIWVIGLGLFGTSLLLVGYLAFRPGFMAKVFGILLAIAQLVFVGEVAIVFWLLIKGRRLPAN